MVGMDVRFEGEGENQAQFFNCSEIAFDVIDDGIDDDRLAGIAVGVIVFADTGMSALALLYVIGAYAIVLGAAAISAAFILPLPGGDSALLGLTGVVSIAFGVVMFAKPGDGALALLALIAAYAVIIGLAELTVAIGGKRVFGFSDERYASPQVSR
jgi:hypothetical protein